eukprot:69976-Lingulodinium_polyedra.AAC.1
MPRGSRGPAESRTPQPGGQRPTEEQLAAVQLGTLNGGRARVLKAGDFAVVILGCGQAVGRRCSAALPQVFTAIALHDAPGAVQRSPALAGLGGSSEVVAAPGGQIF